MNRLDKELAIISLAYGFLNNYLSEVVEQKANLDIYAEVVIILKQLTNLLKLYRKRAEPLQETVTQTLVNIEAEARKVGKVEDKYRKKPRLSGNDIEVHGLLFPLMLVLEQREIQGRQLVLNYKLAQKIADDFTSETKKTVANSRILAREFADRIGDVR